MTAHEHGYQLLEILGVGSFGTVVKAVYSLTGEEVAIKLISNFAEYDYTSVKLVRELKIMEELKKVNEIDNQQIYSPKLLDVFTPHDENSVDTIRHVFIAMTCAFKDLKKLVDLRQNSGLSEDHIKVILYNSLCSLKYLHSANIIHRDIKPGNILINESCQVMICDFGIARTLPDSCSGKGSNNTRRIRDSIYKQNIGTKRLEDDIANMISKKLQKHKEEYP